MRHGCGTLRGDMHELSLMTNLLDAAVATAARRPDCSLRMRVGPLSGVVLDALRFAFEALAPGTPAEDARLDIEETALGFPLSPLRSGLSKPRSDSTNVPPAAPPTANCAGATNWNLSPLRCLTMCDTCGCGDPHNHSHEHGHVHGHAHSSHDHGNDSVPVRTISVQKPALALNQRHADQNRGWFRAKGLKVFNLLSSPGSGKTALLERTLRGHPPRRRDRRRPSDRKRCRAPARLRRAGHPDHHRRHLPPGRAHGRPRPGPARHGRPRNALHRERRQSRLPRLLRSGRRQARRPAVRHRGRGQALEVSGDFPQRRSRC